MYHVPASPTELRSTAITFGALSSRTRTPLSLVPSCSLLFFRQLGAFTSLCSILTYSAHCKNARLLSVSFARPPARSFAFALRRLVACFFRSTRASVLCVQSVLPQIGLQRYVPYSSAALQTSKADRLLIVSRLSSAEPKDHLAVIYVAA